MTILQVCGVILLDFKIDVPKKTLDRLYFLLGCGSLHLHRLASNSRNSTTTYKLTHPTIESNLY